MVVRDNHRQLRALSPICRHRGTPLVSESGSCRLFACPYHGWTYSLEGELVKAPQMEQAKDFDLSRHKLPAIRLETWAGFLFVNFDPDAEGLLQTLGSLPRIMERYNLDDMVVTRNKTYMLDCNWKLYIDNTIEIMARAVRPSRHDPEDRRARHVGDGRRVGRRVLLVLRIVPWLACTHAG